MSIRSPVDFVRDILDAIREIDDFVRGMDRAAFTSDVKTIRAVELEFIIIGEAASKVPDAIQQANPAIPWGVMKSMRNRLVHGYFSVDANVLWDTIRNDLPPLAAALQAIIAQFP